MAPRSALGRIRQVIGARDRQETAKENMAESMIKHQSAGTLIIRTVPHGW
jgi:hypothetical protein